MQEKEDSQVFLWLVNAKLADGGLLKDTRDWLSSCLVAIRPGLTGTYREDGFIWITPVFEENFE